MKFLRALLFWIGIAVGFIALCGAYTVLNLDAPTAAPIWRQS